MTILETTAPIRTFSEANRRDHWAVKAKRARLQRNVCRVAVSAAHKMPIKDISILQDMRLVITLTRIGPRRLDCDNLNSACKACRDGIADAIGVNDGSAKILWDYAQEIGKPYAVRIKVETIESSFSNGRSLGHR